MREGWTAGARAELREEAQAYASRHESWIRQIGSAGVDLVRLDCKAGSCGHCARYCGGAFTLTGETEGLPPPPPLPICPACRHTLNLLTPFYMQGLGLDVDDLIADARPYVED